MLRGFATVNFYADDLEEAGRWYHEATGVEPYFRVYACGGCGNRSREARCADCDADTMLGYLELRIGDYEHELGFVNRMWAPPQPDGPGGAIVYWHVDNLQETLDHLESLGAKPHAPITEHGPGFVTASVVDPFGNVLGIMYNAHYLSILAREDA
ncbi:VOC family protein [Pseudonocardia sp. GCM10023141]|uniref:VOC family protein n=1 Tax=Pseudonocardia sp. GCM10023141 TaxID=3252653 RepID=UPI00360C3183